MNTAVIYARVSSVGSRQDTSRQIADLREYAVANGLQAVQVFEEHQSGAEERPVWEECIDYCIANQIDTLLLSELSRAGRSVASILGSIQRLTDAKVNVYLQKEQMNTLTIDKQPQPLLSAILAMLGSLAELERENIMYRLNSGRRRYIEAGGTLGRPKGTPKTKEQLSVEYKAVIRELKRGTSIRRTAKLCDLSPTTVAKVKTTLGL